jgi:hypothetical protein
MLELFEAFGVQCRLSSAFYKPKWRYIFVTSREFLIAKKFFPFSIDTTERLQLYAFLWLKIATAG